MFADSFSVLSIHCVARGLGASSLCFLPCIARWFPATPRPCCTAHGRVSSGILRLALPLEIIPSHGESGPYLIIISLAHKSHNPNGISIGPAVFATLITVTDRQTDRPRYSVCNNRPHLCVRSMRPKNTTFH